MDGLSWVGQDSFAAGAFPLQERVPAAAVEDCVNGLYGDDGSIFKRGGSAYKGSAAAASLIGIYDVRFVGGQRTLLQTSTAFYQLAVDDSTPAAIIAVMAAGTLPMRRLAMTAGLAIFPVADATGFDAYMLFGGSRKTAQYTTGTLTFTEGSTQVTGVGTLWVANLDAGMILFDPQLEVGVVRSVDSNTTLTLAAPWPYATRTGTTYVASPFTFHSAVPLPLQGTDAPYVAAAANRFFLARGEVIYFTTLNKPLTIASTDYHAVPVGASVTGLQGWRDKVLVFTTAGTFVIENVAFDLTDALGNVQQRIESLNTDLVLWHDNGIVDWHGAVVVPATDNVYLIEGDGQSVSIADPIRALYRGYVAAGYTLGLASVVHGHYVLPVLNGSTWVDTLVCRLDTRAWSRASGFSGSCISFASRVAADATRSEKLFGINGSRIVDCSGWFAPAAGNKSEADGSTHTFTLTCRTVQRPTAQETLRKVRVRYELDDAASDDPTLAAAVAVGRPGSSFTGLTGTGPENVGQTPQVWTKVNRTGSEFRLRLTSAGPSASLVVRSVEYGFRPSGRQ